MNLVLNWIANGRTGQGTLTAQRGEDILCVEKLNLTRSKARAEFLDALCKADPDLDRPAAEGELLKLAGEVAKENGDGKTDSPGALPEIDVSSIIRPERFITPEVSGLAVPTMTVFADKPQGQWKLYRRWSDGRRECLPMPSAIELPNKRKLWIHPRPGEPAATMRPGWSAESRRRWLDGAETPDPAEVFKRLCKRIAYFLDLPRGHGPGVTATLTLWTLLSYVYQAWDAVPYLFIGGPLGSGKSRAFEILSRLVFRPLSSSNMTGAAMFRTLHNQGGTLFLDEAERLRDTRSPDVGDVLSMLLAGYKRGGSATRLEPVGDTFKTVTFDVYGPKALACIAGLPPALASRAIPIIMFRAAPGSEKPRRRIDAEPARWQSLRDELHALALEYGTTWLELAERDDVCPRMAGRDYELWQPLLALASWIEFCGAPDLLKLMQDHALEVIDSGKDDQTPGHDETLLRILAGEIQSGYAPTPGEILAKAKETEPESFKRWTAKSTAGHLKRYGLTTHKSHGRRVYGRVTQDDLQRIQGNYFIDLGLDENGDTYP